VATHVDTEENAMASVGIRELKQNTSAVLRRVREGGEEVEITLHGRVVARLVPVIRQTNASDRRVRSVWSDIDRLAEEIGSRWPRGVTAARAVRDTRRG
jgi:prevent-host-death family protein